MLYVIIGMGCMFVAIGFLITEKNAQHLLAGYNTLTEAERARFDLQAYLPFFRNFHVFLGVSFIGLGLLLYRFWGEGAAGIFMGVYPIVMYVLFLWVGERYSLSAAYARQHRLALWILLACLVLLVGMFYWGFRENELQLQADRLEFTGMYGETVAVGAISGIALVDSLPPIRRRTNGFRLGKVRKGYYQTERKAAIKLLVHREQGPYLLLERTEGTPLYFAPEQPGGARRAYEQIRRAFPELPAP